MEESKGKYRTERVLDALAEQIETVKGHPDMGYAMAELAEAYAHIAQAALDEAMQRRVSNLSTALVDELKGKIDDCAQH